MVSDQRPERGGDLLATICSSTSTAPPCCFSFLQVLCIVRRERLLMVVAAVLVVAMVTGVIRYLDTGISSGNLAEMTEAEAGADSGRTD